jgi:hypothetical protein
MGVDSPRSDIQNIFFLGYTARGEAFEIEGELWSAVPEDYELGKKFFALAEKLLEQRMIKGHPATVRESDLSGILDGMQELTEGKVSGVKLVYRVGEAED